MSEGAERPVFILKVGAAIVGAFTSQGAALEVARNGGHRADDLGLEIWEGSEMICRWGFWYDENGNARWRQ